MPPRPHQSATGLRLPFSTGFDPMVPSGVTALTGPTTKERTRLAGYSAPQRSSSACCKA